MDTQFISILVQKHVDPVTLT